MASWHVEIVHDWDRNGKNADIDKHSANTVDEEELGDVDAGTDRCWVGVLIPIVGNGLARRYVGHNDSHPVTSNQEPANVERPGDSKNSPVEHQDGKFSK